MFAASKRLLFRKMCAFPTGALLLFHICSVGEPLVTVTALFSGSTITYTVDAREFPELKGITFNCTYDSQTIAILDAIVSAPVPATAFSVLLKKETASVTFTVVAASTVSIENDKTIMILHIPAQNEACISGFSITKATITDKNGAVIDAAIQQGTTVMVPHPPAYRSMSFIQHTQPSQQFQINGRQFSRGRKITTPGFYIRRGTVIVPAGFVSLK